LILGWTGGRQQPSGVPGVPHAVLRAVLEEGLGGLPALRGPGVIASSAADPTSAESAGKWMRFLSSAICPPKQRYVEREKQRATIVHPRM